MLPWAYFLVVSVGPISTYDKFGKESVGISGVLAFIEFIGLPDAIIIYTKTALVCALLVYFVCVVYDVMAGKCATKH